MSQSTGWTGIDLDGTLAFYDHWRGADHIGDPIPAMQKRVMDWAAEGRRLKIFTARVHDPTSVPIIAAWLEKWGFPPFEITNVKDFEMWELYDDRCHRVEKNTGRIYDAFSEEK